LLLVDQQWADNQFTAEGTLAHVFLSMQNEPI
jgi:hypothetical protein